LTRIEQTVLRRIGEDTTNPDAFSDITPIRDSINDAIEEILILTGSNKQRITVKLNDGITIYDLVAPESGRVAWISRVWLQDRKMPLVQTHPIALSRMSADWLRWTGTPTMYFPIHPDKIAVYPRPTADGDMLEIWAAVLPARYDDDDAYLPIQVDYEQALTDYAVSQYWASRGDANEAARVYRRYAEAVGLAGKEAVSDEAMRGLKGNPRPGLV